MKSSFVVEIIVGEIEVKSPYEEWALLTLSDVNSSRLLSQCLRHDVFFHHSICQTCFPSNLVRIFAGVFGTLLCMLGAPSPPPAFGLPEESSRGEGASTWLHTLRPISVLRLWISEGLTQPES